jgi:hypothetical protein
VTIKARLFLSWCHADQAAKDALVPALTRSLRNLRDVDVDWWEDSHLLIGEDWRRTILARLDECDYGVLLLSPAFFASDFVVRHELPRFVGPAAVRGALPVRLEWFPLDGTFELHGVDGHQIYPSDGRSFAQTRGTRNRFVVELAAAVRRRILADA